MLGSNYIFIQDNMNIYMNEYYTFIELTLLIFQPRNIFSRPMAKNAVTIESAERRTVHLMQVEKCTQNGQGKRMPKNVPVWRWCCDVYSEEV